MKERNSRERVPFPEMDISHIYFGLVAGYSVPDITKKRSKKVNPEAWTGTVSGLGGRLTRQV